MEGRAFQKFQKNQKSFKIQNVPKLVPKSVQTCFEHVWGNIFEKFFAQGSLQGISDSLDLEFWVPILEIKKMSSVFRTYKDEFSFRHKTQQSFFLHLRHSQCTQFHFRFSWLKIVSSASRN